MKTRGDGSMFNKQLKINIADIDAQIGVISKEIEEHKRDNKYEVKMEKLQALTELRFKLGKVEDEKKSDTIIELDKQIEELTKLIANLEKDEEYTVKLKKLEDLTKIRTQLSETKVKESLAPHIISGALGLGAVALVLNYEKTEIIRGQAFSVAMRLFGRGK
jgi:DNA repair exonuclease SbcCD ATPase subunit